MTTCGHQWPSSELPDLPHSCVVRPGWHVTHVCHCGATFRAVGDEPGLVGDAGIAEVVRALNEVDASDPERAHSVADELLLRAVPLEVRDAYRQLAGRADWWAAA